MPAIDVKGFRLAYRETGAGEPVLLLHSSASTAAQWRALSAQLSKRFHVLIPDLHGYGATDPWPGRAPLTLADEAALIGILVERAGAPVHVVGHSYGGAVALQLALQRPDRLRTLTVIEPVAFHLLRDGDRSDRALFEEIETLADAVAEGVLKGDAWRAMQYFVDYWNGAGTWAALSEERRDGLGRSATAVVLNFAAIFAEPTPLEAYRGLPLPTLLLCGERTPAPTARITALLAATLPDARIRLIGGAGHMLPLTHRTSVNAAVADHLGGTVGRLRRAA